MVCLAKNILDSMSIKIKYFGASDVGRVRRKNEDAWGAIPEGNVFILADGMGGHRAGDVAAKEAVDALRTILKQKLKEAPHEKEDPMLFKQFVYEAIKDVNAIVYSISTSDSRYRGMGTTLCCLCLLPNSAILAHVGDSRIYLQRGGRLSLLTKDHSLAHELFDLGQLDDEQVGRFTHKNIITKAIGNEKEVEPTLDMTAIDPDDLFLICSDGLTDMVSKEEIQDILRSAPSIEEGGRALINAALQNGGIDNVTVILVKVENNGTNLPR